MRLRHKSWAEELLANNRNLALNKEYIEQGNFNKSFSTYGTSSIVKISILGLL